MGRRMTKIRLRYVQAYRSGDQTYFYFRRPGVRVRLPGNPGSPEFMEAYRAAQGNKPVFDNHPSGTVGALIAGYCASGDFKNLKPNTQSAYRIVLSRFGTAHGHRLVRDMTRDNARKIIEAIIERPGMANLTRSVLKRLMRHAVDRGWRNDNPVVGISPQKIGTRHTWTDGELAAYEARWPLGTRERLAYAVLLYTGQRGGDVVQMDRPLPGATTIALKQQKTGVELVIPIHPELRAAIKAGPTSLHKLITDKFGRPIKRPALTLLIRAAAKKAGLSRDCTAHGLRKSLLRRLAEDGKSSKEIASISGHKSLREIERYTAAADQAKLARAAFDLPTPKKR